MADELASKFIFHAAASQPTESGSGPRARTSRPRAGRGATRRAPGSAACRRCRRRRNFLFDGVRCARQPVPRLRATGDASSRGGSGLGTPGRRRRAGSRCWNGPTPSASEWYHHEGFYLLKNNHVHHFHHLAAHTTPTNRFLHDHAQSPFNQKPRSQAFHGLAEKRA